MAAGHVQVAPDSTGKNVDTVSIVSTEGGTPTVQRQVVICGDPTTYGNQQAVDSSGNAAVAVKTRPGAANLNIAVITASTTAATLVIARATRRSVTIRNTDQAINVWVGPATVTSGNGWLLLPFESYTPTWTGLIQVIAASGSPIVVAWDEYD
jgi:hypothetical protein